MGRTVLNSLRKVALRSKEGKKIIKEFNEKYGTDIAGRKVEKTIINSKTILFIDGKPLIVVVEDILIPTLINVYVFNKIPSITVDMGAVPFICNGADVMIPGIRDSTLPLRKDLTTVILDENHRKPIAVGITIIDLINLQGKGKAIKNLHYVGDIVWNAIKGL